MREVDRALERAYSLHEPAGPPAEPTSASAASPARSGRAGSGPHFPVESSAPLRGTSTTLRWPSTVKALERQHGDRFARLAEALIEARECRQIKALLFTSCHRAEGRTTLILTLARALARRPGRTLLVDADLSGPMLARQLGLRPRVGLDDVLEGGLAASEALIEVPDDNLSLLPLRGPVARPREVLAGPAWSCLMARLRREFDTVLIDGSPLFAGLSVAALHRSVDAAILVHHRGLTGDRALLRAQEVLDAGGIPLLGLAETFV